MEKRHWRSKELVKFGKWLWDEGHYEYGMLCFHGVSFGLKIGVQLELKWSDIIGKQFLEFSDKKITKRPISSFCKRISEIGFKEWPKTKLEDPIYVSGRTGEVITTSNLSKNLQRHSEKYMVEMDIDSSSLNPLKSNCFQIAWATDMLESYNYSRFSFAEVGKFIGKRTVGDMSKFVGIEPNDNIEMKFDLLERNGVHIIAEEYRTKFDNGRVKIEDFVLGYE